MDDVSGADVAVVGEVDALLPHAAPSTPKATRLVAAIATLRGITTGSPATRQAEGPAAPAAAEVALVLTINPVDSAAGGAPGFPRDLVLNRVSYRT